MKLQQILVNSNLYKNNDSLFNSNEISFQNVVMQQLPIYLGNDLDKNIMVYKCNHKFWSDYGNAKPDLIAISEDYNYYSIIDFEVLLDNDPQGGSHIREAMSCERAVISVDGNSGVQRDLIQNNKTGFLVSPDSRISEAAEIIIKNYSDKEFLKEIGSNAREFIKQHSFANLSKIILKKIS